MEVSKMSDELEIYEAKKYKQKDEELDLREEDKGGGISPILSGISRTRKNNRAKRSKVTRDGNLSPIARGT